MDTAEATEEVGHKNKSQTHSTLSGSCKFLSIFVEFIGFGRKPRQGNVSASNINILALRKMILTEFKLPLAATTFEADYHYENVIPPMLDQAFDGSHA